MRRYKTEDEAKYIKSLILLLRAFPGSLTPREFSVFVGWYIRRRSLAVMAEKFDISKTRIASIRRKAETKLREKKRLVADLSNINIWVGP